MFYFEEINSYKILKSDLLSNINHSFTLRNVTPDLIIPKNKKIELNDGTTKVIFNSSAYEKENNLEISAFLKYIKTKVPTSIFTDRLHRLVEEHKLNNKFKNEYLAMNLHDRDITRKAFQEGAEQTKIETAKKLLLEKIPIEIISKATTLPLEKIQELASEVTK